LGAATAQALAQENAHVVVSGRRGQLAEDLAGGMPSAIGVEVDLTTERGPDELIDATTDAFGGVDVLVLNGPGPQTARALDVTPNDVTAAIATLVRPHVRLVQLVIAGMRQRGWRAGLRTIT
jgi:3-oxoacyl-[acyl-carrier protein] reductase